MNAIFFLCFVVGAVVVTGLSIWLVLELICLLALAFRDTRVCYSNNFRCRLVIPWWNWPFLLVGIPVCNFWDQLLARCSGYETRSVRISDETLREIERGLIELGGKRSGKLATEGRAS